MNSQIEKHRQGNLGLRATPALLESESGVVIEVIERNGGSGEVATGLVLATVLAKGAVRGEATRGGQKAALTTSPPEIMKSLARLMTDVACGL